MTREEALSQLAGTWHFNEVDGLISVREVELIKALAARESETIATKTEFITQTPANGHWTPR